MFSTASMQWKILHLLVCFEVNRDDFSVTSIFGHPVICLILVLNSRGPNKTLYGTL